jgi:hypothetical protein
LAISRSDRGRGGRPTPMSRRVASSTGPRDQCNSYCSSTGVAGSRPPMIPLASRSCRGFGSWPPCWRPRCRLQELRSEWAQTSTGARLTPCLDPVRQLGERDLAQQLLPGQVVGSASATSSGLNTSTASAGAGPNSSTTVRSSKLLSSATLRKSRIAVPEQ